MPSWVQQAMSRFDPSWRSTHSPCPSVIYAGFEAGLVGIMHQLAQHDAFVSSLHLSSPIMWKLSILSFSLSGPLSCSLVLINSGQPGPTLS